MRQRLEPAEAKFLLVSILLAGFLMSLASFARHWLLQSNLFDLGIFDQGIYLISQGLPPISTTLGFHMLGDHAAFILYPLALFYRLIPGVGWLFIIQGFCLALGALPLYRLARREGLSPQWSKAIATSYLLYPAVFNIALFDFHPETIALPALIWALWAGLERRHVQLVVGIALVLSCKAVLSLTVVLLGVYLLFNRRWVGSAVMLAGGAWYGFTAYYLIPLLTGRPPAALGRYGYLGQSLSEITWNVLTHPSLLLTHALQPTSLFYLLGLVVPVLLGLHWRKLGAVVPALPMLAMNLLSTEDSQRDLVHQYSLSIVPFILFWLLRSVSYLQETQGRQWLKPRVVVIGSIVGFLALAKFGYFFSLYLTNLSNYASVQKALAMIKGPEGVLTTSGLCAQLSERETIQMTDETRQIEPALFDAYSYVLLDLEHPNWRSSRAYATALADWLGRDPRFQAALSEDGVLLFVRVSQSDQRQMPLMPQKSSPPGG